MIKYASNAFLATKISFINAIADICEKANADVTQVVKGMGYDSRIGTRSLNPGLGFGGSCFPKDSSSLYHTATKLGVDFQLLKSVIAINDERAPHFLKKMKSHINSFKGKTIGILGLAFKPNTDDLREAKSIEIIKLLLKEGAKIKAYDPAAMEDAKKIISDDEIMYCPSSYDTAKDCDAIAIITEWNEFRLLNLEKIKSLMKKPVIFDGRNIYDPKRTKQMGFDYYSIGR